MAATEKLHIHEYDGVFEDPSLWLHHVMHVGKLTNGPKLFV